MSFHTIIAVGNVGKEPEMRYLPSGQPVTSFSLATNRQYTNSSGQTVKETIWFRISVFGKQAESCSQYVHKGNQVLVEGRLVADEKGGPRIWQRQDGTSGASFEINAQTVRFLTRKDAEATGGEEEAAAPAVNEDEIPF
jgi:single-strand DNA-binding protein